MIFLNIFFFPVIWQGKTFVYERGMPQVMPYGVWGYNGFRPTVVKEIDPGGSFWGVYPACKLTNIILFSEREFPLWNPYNGAGTPYIAESTTPIYNIFASILFLFPSCLTMDFYILLRFFLAGLFMYFFCKRLYSSFIVSVFCGIAYMFQGYSLMYLSHIPNNVYFMAPLLFLTFFNLLRDPSLRNTILAGIVIGFLILAGFPESSFLVILIGYSYLFITLLLRFKKQDLNIIRYAILAGIIGLLLSAVYVLPLYEFTLNSFHAHSKIFLGEISGLMAAGPLSNYFIRFLIPLFDSIDFLESRYGGIALTYFGIAVFTLALFGVIYVIYSYLRKYIRKKNLPIKPVAGAKSVAVFFILLILMFLKYSGWRIINWIGNLPVFNIILFAHYLSPLIAFSMIIISGWGLKYFLKTRKVKLCIPHCLSIITVGLIISYYSIDKLWSDLRFEGELRYLNIPLMIALGFIVLLLMALFFSDKRAKRPGTLYFLSVLIIGFELFFNFIFFEYYYFEVLCDRYDLYKEAPYIRCLREHAGYNRVFGIDKILHPNWSSAFGIFDARNIYALTPLRWVEFYRYFFPGGKLGEDTFDRFTGAKTLLYGKDNASFRRFAQLCSIKYYLSKVFTDTNNAKNVYAGEIFIDELNDSLPRASIFHNIEIINSDKSILDTLKAPNFDPTHTLVIKENIPQAIKERIRAASSENCVIADIIEYKTRRVKIRAATDRPGFLMLNDINYPGWNAYVDNAKTDIYTANYLFRAVFLERGSHIVEFRYEPLSFKTGAAVSLITLLAICVIWILL